MSHPLGRALEIFRQALDLEVEERAAFLERECGLDESLRAEVDALLAADERDDGTFSEESLLERREGWDRFLNDEVDAWKTLGDSDPEKIGSYEVVRRIGEGGMGIVYEAKQEVPRRSVALKVLSRTHSSKRTLRRFQREAQVLGRLVHPGIAQIFEAGTYDSGQGAQPFFAMEYVEGESLRAWSRRVGRTREECLKVFCSICEAVQHAHDQGVIHRDLKPENVIITNSNQPKVLDFGVARAQSPEQHLTTLRTMEGQLLGTVAYMSPEQASGGREEVDARSDVYSLGVILFELLTGELPHESADLPITEAVHSLRTQEPRRLRELDTTLRGDLETIVSRALQRERHQRYDSAQTLADEVRRHLLHEPIQARPTTALYTLRKMARRHRGLTAGVILSGLTLFGGVQLGKRFWATKSEPSVLRPIHAASVTRLRNTLREAESAIGQVEYAKARSLLDDLGEETSRAWEARYLLQKTEPVVWTAKVSDLRPRYKWGTPAVFSENGSRVFAFINMRVLGVWSTETGEELQRIDIPGGVGPHSLRQSKGRLSLLGGDKLRIYSADNGTLLHEQEIATGARSHSWSSAGDRLAINHSAGEDGFEIYCGPPNALEKVASGPQRLARLCWAEEDQVLFALRSFDGYRAPIHRWDTATWSETRIPLPGQGDSEALAASVSLDGSLLAVTDRSAVPRIWNLEGLSPTALTLPKPKLLFGHDHETINEVVTSDKGDRLATVAVTHELLTWDAESGLPTNRLDVEWYGRLSVSPDQRLLSVRDRDRVRLMSFGPTSPEELTHESAVRGVSVSPDGVWLVSTTDDSSVHVWDRATRRKWLAVPTPGRVDSDAFETSAIRFSSDGSSLELHTADSLHEWDLALGNGWQLASRDSDPFDAGYVSNGTSDSLRADLRRGQVVDSTSGSVLCRLEGFDASAGPALGALCADASLLAVAAGELTIYDASRGKRVASLPELSDPVTALAFDPLGERLAVGTKESKVRLYETVSFQLVHELRFAEGDVTSLAWSPDGEVLVRGSSDGTVTLLDAVNREARTAEKVEARSLETIWRARVDQSLRQLGDLEAVAQSLRRLSELGALERRAREMALRDALPR